MIASHPLTSIRLILVLFGVSALLSKADETHDSIQVYIEQYQISALEYADLSTKSNKGFDQTALRNQLLAKAKADLGTKKPLKTELINSHILTTIHNQRAVLEVLKELIYATEYDPPEIGNAPFIPTGISPPSPTAFETRNTGDTIELTAKINEDDNTISLQFKPENVTYLGDTLFADWKLKKQHSKIVMPEFASHRVSSNFKLQNGKFLLTNTHSPITSKKIDHSKKVLTFIRATKISNHSKK